MKKKSLQVSAKGTVGENYIEGIASVMGVVDRQRDVIMPGAFDTCIDSFLKRGFVPSDHSWSVEDIVAMPTACESIGNRLMLRAEFHSDDDSQAIRQKVKERIGKGLEVGLSIGFGFDSNQYVRFENGADFWAWAKGKEYDLNLLDASIQQDDKPVWAIPQIKELYEVSIVAVPANERAIATAVKSEQFGGAPELTLEQELDAVLAAVHKVTARVNEVGELRKAEGRNLQARQSQLKEMIASLSAWVIPDSATFGEERMAKARRIFMDEWLQKMENK